MTAHDVTLVDKYTKASGRVFISGIQALVRLPMEQIARDRRPGSTPAASSRAIAARRSARSTTSCGATRRCSPSTMSCSSPASTRISRRRRSGDRNRPISSARARPMACSASGTARGRASIAPMDVLKHANAAGTSPHGGVLAIAGDDHGCQSSTLPHQSEQLFEAALMPVLNPATVQEYLDFGLYGIALSRFSGCWVGFKAIAETVGERGVDRGRSACASSIVIPTDFDMPPGGLHIRWPDPPLESERRLHGPKMRAVAAFVRANAHRPDRSCEPPAPRFGIITTGKAYLDVRQALEDLGIDEAAVAALGIRIYKLGLTWPIERQGALRFAEGLHRHSCRRGEARLHRAAARRAALQHAGRSPARASSARPTKRGASAARQRGRDRADRRRARRSSRGSRASMPSRTTCAQRVARLESFEAVASGTAAQAARPFSARAARTTHRRRFPKAAARWPASAATAWRSACRSASTATITQMGGEGVNWIGQAPFTERQAHLPEPRRRHLYAQRLDGDPRRRRRRRQHHLQDPLSTTPSR